MVTGIGTDILKLSQIKKEHVSGNDPFLMKVYTEKEREQAMERDDPHAYFCTRFSGKEAVFKALNTDGDAIRLNEIEILSGENLQPVVYLHGRAAIIAESQGVTEIKISLSYDTDYAVSFAIAQNNGKEN